MKEINTKKRILRLIVSCFCILIFILIVFAVLESGPVTETDEYYLDYVCLDPNLTYLKAGGVFAEYKTDNKPTYTFRYRKISDTDTSDFVACQTRLNVLFPNTKTVVLQNPQSEINVISEWNISEIQFYIEPNEINRGDGWEPDYKKYGKKSISYSSSNKKCIEDIYNILNGDNYTAYSLISADLPYNSNSDVKQLYIHLIFEENPYIVWDAKIIRTGEQCGVVVYYFDPSYTPSLTSINSRCYIFSDNLNTLVSDAFNAIQ